MTFDDWVAKSATRIKSDGVRGATDSLYELYVGALRRLGHIYNFGESFFDKEWDILIVLDACRPDLLSEIEGDYEFLSHQETFLSNSSSSEEWLDKNFVNRPEDAAETIYVTGNPFSQQYLTEVDIHTIDEVWQYAWDEDAGTIPPDPITDRAIHHRRHNPDTRLVVHYMQPHYPFISSELSYSLDVDSFGVSDSRSVWEDLRRGEVSRESVWEGYQANLRHVLNSVETLLKNADAETVAITADHGNAVGEWGVYGHPSYVPLKTIKRVPWVVTTARDSREYEPVTEPNRGAVNESVSDRLEDLGYK